MLGIQSDKPDMNHVEKAPVDREIWMRERTIKVVKIDSFNNKKLFTYYSEFFIFIPNNDTNAIWALNTPAGVAVDSCNISVVLDIIHQWHNIEFSSVSIAPWMCKKIDRLTVTITNSRTCWRKWRERATWNPLTNTEHHSKSDNYIPFNIEGASSSE